MRHSESERKSGRSPLHTPTRKSHEQTHGTIVTHTRGICQQSVNSQGLSIPSLSHWADNMRIFFLTTIMTLLPASKRIFFTENRDFLVRSLENSLGSVRDWSAVWPLRAVYFSTVPLLPLDCGEQLYTVYRAIKWLRVGVSHTNSRNNVPCRSTYSVVSIVGLRKFTISRRARPVDVWRSAPDGRRSRAVGAARL